MNLFFKWLLVIIVTIALVSLGVFYWNTFNFRLKCSTIAGVLSKKALCANKVLEKKGSSAVKEVVYDETWITVFVHGIMGIRPHLSISNIIRFTKDDVHGTEYAKAVEIMRKDPTFYKHQPMQELGFHSIDKNRVAPGYASGAMAYLIDYMSRRIHINTYINNIFYTFGWSGITTESARYQAGRELYHLLAKEVLLYQEKGVYPKIRIIGYSHGGNVALNLGAVRDYKHHPFVVNELILLGTPIQIETDHLIQSSIFEKAYHLFSQADRVQRMDCFSYKRLFSKKTFEPRANFDPPEKLRQIEIRVTDTIRTKQSTQLGQKMMVVDNKAYISGKSRFLRDRSPGHAELWFFGWTPQDYRNTYPLYPLPTIALTPFIVKHVEDFLAQEQNTKETIVVDFRPTYGQLIVRRQNSFDYCSIHNFLTNEHLSLLHEYLKGYIPTNYTQELYNRQVEYACQLAKHMYKTSKALPHTVKL